MDGSSLPPSSEGGVSELGPGGEAKVPAQDAVALAQLIWLYEQKAEIEKAIFNILRKIAPDQ
jgi:hypothetical protein